MRPNWTRKLQQYLYFWHSSALPFSQKATVMDKKPVHSTISPVTSLQTSPRVSSPASLDFSAAEHRALEDTMLSSTVLTPLTTDPMATPDVSPRASPSPLVKPTQEVSIKEAVSVLCEIEKIVLAIQKRFLQQESIPESSLFLGQPGCNVSTSNGTHAVLQAGWSDCGTQVETVSPLIKECQQALEHFVSLSGGERQWQILS